MITNKFEDLEGSGESESGEWRVRECVCIYYFYYSLFFTNNFI